MTIYAQLLELSDPPDAYVRGHGWGSVRVLCAGSLNANPWCWVRLYKSGKMLVVDQADLRLAPNPGDPRDGLEIPPDWIPAGDDIRTFTQPQPTTTPSPETPHLRPTVLGLSVLSDPEE